MTHAHQALEAVQPTPIRVRYYPLCVPPHPPHPGFDKAPDGITHERVETFADGTTQTEIVNGCEGRTAPGWGGVRNEDFVDEDWVAMCFAKVHAGRVRYCHAWRAWLVWDGTIWRRDTDDTIIRLIRLLVRDLAEGNARALAHVGTARFLAATERVARSEAELATPADAFDADPMRLGTPAGPVDLTTGDLASGVQMGGASLTADPAHLVTRATAVAPAETADCPLWRRFLAEATGGDGALQDFLQRFLGYALTGDTSEHALLFLHGDGGNGKTVFLNTIAGILGDYSIVAAPGTFTAQARRAHSSEIAMLRGARLVTASDSESGRGWQDPDWDQERLKRLTGGESVTARVLRGDFFTYRPRFKLVCAGNRAPPLRGVDAAIRRRFCLVPFHATPAAPDHRLEAHLRAEWPAILRWMIEGCRAWQAEGLGRPPCVVAATEAYLGAQDLVGQFLDETCATDAPGRTETASALYTAWTAWAKAASEPPGTQRLFAAALDARGFARTRTEHARLYRGLRLLPAEDRGA